MNRSERRAASAKKRGSSYKPKALAGLKKNQRNLWLRKLRLRENGM